MRAIRKNVLAVIVGFAVAACHHGPTKEDGPALAEGDVPIETNVGNEEGNVLALGRCYPEWSLSDEAPEIQALEATTRDAYMVSECPTIGCGEPGSAKAESNELKNRSATPEATDIDASATLEALVAEGDDDRDRWSHDSAATIVGYVREVKGTGPESVNCREGSKQFSDTHIDVVLNPDDPGSPMFVVEVTQRMRALMAAQGEDWSSAGLRSRLKGKWVEFTGWLFFDQDHCNEAANTDSAVSSADNPCGGPNNAVWRQTAWEIHPVTAFRIVPNP